MSTKGYIYVRTNKFYDPICVCKLGKTENIPERHSQYITCEPHAGRFSLVFEVDNDYLDLIERTLQIEFKDMHYLKSVGFYMKDIMKKIEPVFDKYEIEYRKLSDEEIKSLTRKT